MDNGKALEKFKEMVKAQGGDVSYIENTELFEKPSAIIELNFKENRLYSSIRSKKIRNCFDETWWWSYDKRRRY